MSTTAKNRISTRISMMAFVALLAGCAGGSDTAGQPDTSDQANGTTTVVMSTDDSLAPYDSIAARDDSMPAENDPPTTDAPEPTDPPLIEGADPIELLTPPPAADTQPELTWGPIDGAATYRVVILDADGAPYWSWSGAETAVFLGGGESSDGAGPSVAAGFTWTVTAFDADGDFLAASGIGTLAS